MNTNTSIGPNPDRGGNDNPGNADGCGNKTLGDQATQQPPAGAEHEKAQGDAREPASAPREKGQVA